MDRQARCLPGGQAKIQEKELHMKVLGVILLVLALVVGTVPQFTNCDYNGMSITTNAGKSVPMKCLWTARAELAAAVPLFVIGGMMLFSRRKESSRNLSALGVILGIFVMLLPTSLIGVCSSAMPCNTVMEPTMMLSGSAVILTGIVGVVLAQRREDKV